MPKVIQVIENLEKRGTGDSKDDPVRQVYQLLTLDGRLIMEADPYAKKKDSPLDKKEIKTNGGKKDGK